MLNPRLLVMIVASAFAIYIGLQVVTAAARWIESVTVTLTEKGGR